MKKNPQRGLVILDKSSYEEKIQTLSHVFKHVGHANGQLRNFAEVPLFLDSKASRLIQMADLIAYWIFRHYQSGDQRGYNLIKPYFARYGVGPVSGLCCHVTPETDARLPMHHSSRRGCASFGARIVVRSGSTRPMSKFAASGDTYTGPSTSTETRSTSCSPQSAISMPPSVFSARC